MKKLRILVFMHEDLVPPKEVKREDVLAAPWRTEYDIMSTLEKAGHEVYALGLRSDLGVIRSAIEQHTPHVVFNLLEEFDGVGVFDQNVIAFLELLRVPYTGCNPRGLMLARDKALCKKILSYHRIPNPDFAVIPRGRKVHRPKRLAFPLIVKSLIEEASLGISQASVVHDDKELADRVQFIHDRIATDALIEEFVEGRELYVSVLGNSRLQVFPVWELFFHNMPDHLERIATAKAKWDLKYQEKNGITSGEAKDLPEGVEKRIVQMSRRIFRTLGLNGCARIDFRMRPNGDLYFLEANPNPQLAFQEDFADSAQRAGIPYGDLVQKIVNLGIRWATNRSG